jgi:N-methylhydantoinase A
MIKGIRVVSVAKGYDPREFSLVAFGGAGPLHAGELASELAIPRVLVPVAPGVTSALGLLMADLRHDYVRTILKRGDSLAPRELDAIYRELEAEAVAQLRREGAEDNNIGLTRLADVRYMGQGYELEVTVDDGEMGPDELRQVFERFHETHSRHYGYATRDNPVEVVNLRVVALAMMPRPELSPRSMNGAADPPNARTGQRQVYFSGRRLHTHVYDRSRLQPGDAIAGPAIVEQLDSTTVVWPGQVAGVDAFSNLVLERASQ